MHTIQAKLYELQQLSHVESQHLCCNNIVIYLIFLQSLFIFLLNGATFVRNMNLCNEQQSPEQMSHAEQVVCLALVEIIRQICVSTNKLKAVIFLPDSRGVDQVVQLQKVLL